ncbi:MAG: arginine deiminase-related protein [Crocinitomicaceae bacterium]
MAEPLHFGFNDEAAISNSFQNQSKLPAHELREKAMQEFNNAVDLLRSFGVEISIIQGDENVVVPDAVFPNNWISTHETGQLILYPMAVSNRRAERRMDIVEGLVQREGYEIIDLSHHERQNPPEFLEGTGSLIFDHDAKLVYAAISPRTHQSLVERVASLIGYKAVCFKAFGIAGELIYHTNVMMCVGETFVIIGNKTVDSQDWPRLKQAIVNSGKALIRLSNDQVYHHFAGNMLLVANTKNERLLVLSASARKSLTQEQEAQLLHHNDHLVTLEIPTIEFVGGGSARCMLAEVRSKE